MLKFSSTGAALAKFTLGLTMAATLAACGGGGDSAPAATIAVADLAAVTIDSTTATAATAALTAVSTGFSFPFGVSEFGTTVPTTVSFTAPTAGATTPEFSIAAAGVGTARGTLTFGSCKFEVKSSTISTIAVSSTPIVVTFCAFDAATGGQTVTQGSSSTFTTSSTLLLGTETSAPAEVTVTVTNTNGVNTITVNGGTLGTVTGTVTTATGATGAGS